MSCHPSKLELRKPDDSIKLLSMCVSTPTVMPARMIKPTTIAPWTLSVMKETLKPPIAAYWSVTVPSGATGRLTRIDGCNYAFNDDSRQPEPVDAGQSNNNLLQGR